MKRKITVVLVILACFTLFGCRAIKSAADIIGAETPGTSAGQNIDKNQNNKHYFDPESNAE